jgi:CheY-like chemotaxis protein
MSDEASILLVDDQLDFLENLSITLEAAGYHTITTTDGFEALRALKERHVDLILSDIGMPHMGGYQLFKRVHQNPGWEKIPFVFLTGYEYLSEREILYGKTLGVCGYLTKPIRAVELLTAVEGMLAV